MFKKLKSFYKTNRVYSILMLISIICIIAILVGVLVYFFGQTSKDVYGNRLDGIDKVKISESKKNDIVNSIKSNEKVKSAEVDVRGRLIYVIITVSEGTHVEVEAIAQSSFDSLDEKIKSFYDIQYIVDSQTESEENFPIMGYVKSGNSIIRWTNYSK